MKNHIDASCKSKLTGYCLHVVSVICSEGIISTSW